MSSGPQTQESSQLPSVCTAGYYYALDSPDDAAGGEPRQGSGGSLGFIFDWMWHESSEMGGFHLAYPTQHVFPPSSPLTLPSNYKQT